MKKISNFRELKQLEGDLFSYENMQRVFVPIDLIPDFKNEISIIVDEGDYEEAQDVNGSWFTFRPEDFELLYDTINMYSNSLGESRKRVKEADVDVEKVIKDLIDTNWSKDKDSAGKAVQLIRGLVYSDDPMSTKFIKDLDKKTNEMNIEDYK